MKKNIIVKITFAFLLLTHYAYSQVDVVYNNLVWSDEFNTNGAIDSNKWFHQTQLPSGGSWFNNEVQHYTDLLSNSFAPHMDCPSGTPCIISFKFSFIWRWSTHCNRLC